MSEEKPPPRPDAVPPAEAPPIEAKRNPGRTTHGLRRGTHGPKTKRANSPDHYDAVAKRRAQDVFAGLGPAWAPERRSYADDFAAKLRIDRRGEVRGFFNADGTSKDTLRIKLDVDKRLADREREAREAKLARDGEGAGTGERRAWRAFVIPGREGDPGSERCSQCGAWWKPLSMAATGNAERTATAKAIVPPAEAGASGRQVCKALPNAAADGHVKFFPPAPDTPPPDVVRAPAAPPHADAPAPHRNAVAPTASSSVARVPVPDVGASVAPDGGDVN